MSSSGPLAEQLAESGVEVDEVLAATQLRAAVGLLAVLEHAARSRGAAATSSTQAASNARVERGSTSTHDPAVLGEVSDRVVESRAAHLDDSTHGNCCVPREPGTLRRPSHQRVTGWGTR